MGDYMAYSSSEKIKLIRKYDVSLVDVFKEGISLGINYIRYPYYKLIFRDIGKKCRISTKARINFANRIRLGNNVKIERCAWVCADPSHVKNYGIEIGNRTRIFPYAIVKGDGGLIKIGEDCTVNSFVGLYGGEGGLVIGNGVRIAQGVVISPGNHGFSRTDIPIFKQKITSKGIVIKDDVWLGSNVVVTDGVTIGEGCVIGANAVVTKDIPPYSIAVGIPAEVIKKRK